MYLHILRSATKWQEDGYLPIIVVSGTCSSLSRLSRMTVAMMPRTPPPSMLSTHCFFPGSPLGRQPHNSGDSIYRISSLSSLLPANLLDPKPLRKILFVTPPCESRMSSISPSGSRSTSSVPLQHQPIIPSRYLQAHCKKLSSCINLSSLLTCNHACDLLNFFLHIYDNQKSRHNLLFSPHSG